MKSNLYQDSVWTSLEEIPIYNWNEVATKGDLSFLIKEGKKIGQLDFKKLNDTWIDLQQQYFDEFGIEPEIVDRVKTLEKLVSLNKKYIATDERFLLNLIEIEEEKLKTDNVSYNFYRILDSVEKYKGFAINPKEYPSIKWFHALKNMSKNINNG